MCLEAFVEPKLSGFITLARKAEWSECGSKEIYVEGHNQPNASGQPLWTIGHDTPYLDHICRR